MKQFIEHESYSLILLVFISLIKKSSLGIVHVGLGYGWNARAFPKTYVSLGLIFITTGKKELFK